MGKFDDLPEERRRGLEKMEQVYGFEMTDGEGDFFRYTADHLFADIWNRPGLSDRDRRLLLIGLLAGTGAPRRARRSRCPPRYANGELDDEALREIVIFLCHYAGWPNGARLNSIVEETIAKAEPRTSDQLRGAPAGGVGAAVRAPGPGPGGGGLRRARVRRPRHRGRPTPWPRTRRRSSTRVAVRRPDAPGSFSGTVVVEWLNVSQRLGRRARLDLPGRRDRPPRPRLGRRLRAARRRRGRRRRWSAWSGWRRPGIKARERYAALSHPGDAYCYSIYASVAARWTTGRSPTWSSTCRLAVGESQSAFALTTFVNVVHPQAPVFDGFLIHSRGGAAMPLGEPGVAVDPRQYRGATPMPIRDDLDVPVLMVADRDRPARRAALPARPAARLGVRPALGGRRHRARRPVPDRRVRGAARLPAAGQPRPAGVRRPGGAALAGRLGAGRRPGADGGRASRWTATRSCATRPATPAAGCARRWSTRRSRCCAATPSRTRRTCASCSARPCRWTPT